MGVDTDVPVPDTVPTTRSASGDEECVCRCGYTCHRQCGMSILVCLEQHYKKDCTHVFDGEPVEIMLLGGSGFSATCSKCGLASINHDMRAGP